MMQRALLFGLLLLLLTGCGAIQTAKCALWPLFECSAWNR